MKTQHLNLEDGIAEISGDTVTITDKSKSRKIGLWVLFISSFVYGLSSAIRGYRDNDRGFLVFGVLLSSFWLFAIIKEMLVVAQYKEIFDTQIEMKDIITITFKNNRFGGVMTGKIKLANNRYREIRCSKIDLADSEFEDVLANKGVMVSRS